MLLRPLPIGHVTHEVLRPQVALAEVVALVVSALLPARRSPGLPHVRVAVGVGVVLAGLSVHLLHRHAHAPVAKGDSTTVHLSDLGLALVVLRDQPQRLEGVASHGSHPVVLGDGRVGRVLRGSESVTDPEVVARQETQRPLRDDPIGPREDQGDVVAVVARRVAVDHLQHGAQDDVPHREAGLVEEEHLTGLQPEEVALSVELATQGVGVLLVVEVEHHHHETAGTSPLRIVELVRVRVERPQNRRVGHAHRLTGLDLDDLARGDVVPATTLLGVDLSEGRRSVILEILARHAANGLHGALSSGPDDHFDVRSDQSDAGRRNGRVGLRLRLGDRDRRDRRDLGGRGDLSGRGGGRSDLRLTTSRDLRGTGLDDGRTPILTDRRRSVAGSQGRAKGDHQGHLLHGVHGSSPYPPLTRVTLV